MLAYYWRTRPGSTVRLSIGISALVLLVASSVLGGTAATGSVLLISAFGLFGIADEYRRWRRRPRGRHTSS